MNMSPEYWDNWLGRKQAADLMAIYQTNVDREARKHGISSQVIVGRALFWKPDCERARDAIAKGRAERQSKTTDAEVAK
jgi:hypothetical protein